MVGNVLKIRTFNIWKKKKKEIMEVGNHIHRVKENKH
jgi:hypothetical protein